MVRPVIAAPRIVVLMAWAVLAAGVAVGADTAEAGAGFVARGSYLAASGISALASDACSDPAQQGIDSSCVLLPAALDGRIYSVSYRGTLVVLPVTCFYTSSGAFIDCDAGAGAVREGAAMLAITSWTGAAVTWTLEVNR